MDSLKSFTDTFEETVDSLSGPIRPYLPAIARFLMVVTFLEDSVRIVTQWNDQVNFFSTFRGFPWLLSEIFLALNVITMLVCSVLAIARRYTEYAIGGLFAVMVCQTIAYGFLFSFNFFLRNLSVFGGLLMLLAEAWAGQRKQLFAGLPSMNETDKSTYLQLFGRILLVFLFFSFVFNGHFTIARMFVVAVALVGSVLVVIGFKTKWTAWLLITFLSISNVALNNWWSFHPSHDRRDYVKYDFFQTLSVVGGFLLLANMGAGGLSMDEKKKNF